jgi:hypothetical protein
MEMTKGSIEAPPANGTAEDVDLAREWFLDAFVGEMMLGGATRAKI